MYAASNEVEATLLASVSDNATLDVYADWLEERGDMDRAELLRLHKALRIDPLNHWNADRFAILSRNVDPLWRDRVLQVPRLEEIEVEVPPLPPPPPATVQLVPSIQPRRYTWKLEPGWDANIPLWIRIPSRLAAIGLALSFVLYWLL